MPARATSTYTTPLWCGLLEEHSIDYVVVAGFLRIVGTETVRAYEDRIVKVHHSLLPEFPGPDPVADALELGVKETGVTVHLINRELEAGPIVSQQALEVRDGENWHSLTTAPRARDAAAAGGGAHSRRREAVLTKDDK
jgi:folate-dependent phosphoribosylglycinamide formyltransferase PurN